MLYSYFPNHKAGRGAQHILPALPYLSESTQFLIETSRYKIAWLSASLPGLAWPYGRQAGSNTFGCGSGVASERFLSSTPLSVEKPNCRDLILDSTGNTHFHAIILPFKLPRP